MSHLCKIQMQWKDIRAAKAAAETLGFSFIKGGNVRYYRGPGPECDYTIEFNGARGIPAKYNAGLKRKGEAYELLIDNSIQGAVISDTEKTGRLGGKTKDLVRDFRVEYVKHLAKQHAVEKGYHYEYIGKLKNGRTRIRLTV